MKYLHLKKMAVFLISGILLLAIVGCSTNDVTIDEAEKDTQVAESEEDVVSESEPENVPEELTEIDKQVLAYFENACEQIPELKENCEAGSMQHDTLALGYYEAFLRFSFSNWYMDDEGLVPMEPGEMLQRESDYKCFYDMSISGKKKYVDLMKEYDSNIYCLLNNDIQKLFEEEHSWVPYAEEMFGLTDKNFDKKELERMESEWLEGWNPPFYSAYYQDFYNTFFAEN